jgi:hypothetical protein
MKESAIVVSPHRREIAQILRHASTMDKESEVGGENRFAH